MTDDTTTIDRLDGAQERIVTAYRQADHGLFTLNCGPGVGKSFRLTDLAAKVLLRRWADGDRTPERTLCVLAFARDDAVALSSDICARLDTLVEHDLTLAATAVSPDELATLKRRIRQAPYIGTVDRFLRGLLAEIVADPAYERFDELPAVGHEIQLERIRRMSADESLAAHPDVADRLMDAYPEHEYSDDIEALLRDAHEYCQRQRLSVEAFQARLTASISEVYAEGDPGAATEPEASLRQTLKRCVPGSSADDIAPTLAEVDVSAVVNGDRALWTAWLEHVEDFCAILETYATAYERHTREDGVISHTDCAALVAAYLDDDRESEYRQRILTRYRAIDHWLLDEAQDISTVQHDALARLVTGEDRVFAAGDPRQTIYEFRGAVPEVFADAAETGLFLDVDWDHHVMESATRTYRARPDIATMINTVLNPALEDPARGSCNRTLSPPTLEAVRDPTDEPSVHVPRLRTDGYPGSKPYNQDEAAALARYVAAGLADGTLVPPDVDDAEATTDPPVTVVLRRSTYLDTYVAAFESEGLTVETAAQYVFEADVVGAILDVAYWLAAPDDPDVLRSLLDPQSSLCADADDDSPVGIAQTSSLWAQLDAVDWRLEDCPREAAVDGTPLSVRGQRVVEALDTLRVRHGYGDSQAGSVFELATDIVETLDLRSDANDLLSGESDHTGHTRVAILDALEDWLAELELDAEVSPRTFLELLTPFEDDAWRGPKAATSATDADVQFATIHAMKGDESSTIVLADVGLVRWSRGTVTERLVTTPDTAALAPPDIDRVSCERLGPFRNGLYEPPGRAQDGSDGTIRDAGLRWLAERWVTDDTGAKTLAGHDHLQDIVRRERVSYWRELYVAVTRARDHLVVALPGTVPDMKPPRDRWLETIRSGLGFDGQSKTYTLGPPTGPVGPLQIGVNDVSRDVAMGGTASHRSSSPYAATAPLDPEALERFVPRQISPSTLKPLSDDLDRWLIASLRDEQLHSTATPVDEDLPFNAAAVNAETLGQVLHDILAALVRRARREYPSDWVGAEFLARSVIRNQYPDASQSLREAIVAFVTDTILPQVADSVFWEQLRGAETVYVEHPRRGHRRCEGVQFEIEGQLDLVVKTVTGDWIIYDLKMSFGDLTKDARDRYQLQVETYRTLLKAQVDGSVTTRIETFGVSRKTIEPSLSKDAIQRRLSAFLAGR